ncbi:MAG: histidine kinase dimerization/phospho-acceptor domain-containing protein [Myxococcota bacterium]
MSDIMRSEALRQIAHDLKNPLTAVRVLAEMLLDDASPTLAADLTDIVEAVDVAAVTAEGLADLARLEAGDEPTYAPDVVDLVEVTRDVVARAAFTRVAKVVEPARGSARADESAIVRVLNGVLLNGRRMLKPREVLLVRVGGPLIEVFHPGVHLDTDARDALLTLYGGPMLKARRVRASALGLGYAREALEGIGGHLTVGDADDGLYVRLAFTPR